MMLMLRQNTREKVVQRSLLDMPEVPLIKPYCVKQPR